MQCIASLRGFYKVGFPNFSGSQFFLRDQPVMWPKEHASNVVEFTNWQFA